MASTLFSDLVAAAAKWADPTPSHADLLAAVGAGSAADSTACLRSIINVAARTPTLLCFIIEGDEDHIFVGHSPSIYPADITSPTAFDNLAVVMIGNDLSTCVPAILPTNAFGRTAEIRATRIDAITGAQGHGATPPVLRSGPHGSTAPDTDSFRARRAFLVDPAQAGPFLTTQATGRYTLPGFYAAFLQAPLAAGGAAATAAEPLRDWFRLASTNATGDLGVLRCAVPSPAGPIESQQLQAWHTRQRDAALARLGVGGPALSSAAFTLGVETLKTALEDTHKEKLDYDRTKEDKTFSDRHGAVQAQRMYRWCGVVDDAHLPEIHQLLAKASKAQAFGIIQGMIDERVTASRVPLTQAAGPMATTKIVQDVFRGLMPGGTGLTLGQGLSPFAVVCEGHAKADKTRRFIRQAEMTSSGVSISLSDADKITSADLRLPTEPRAAEEKLYGWSIMVDLFHGKDQDIARQVRSFVIAVAPGLHQVYRNSGETSGAGMERINRVLFEAQQDYFQWLRDAAAGLRPVVPTFSKIQTAVLSFRVDNLSPVPSSWLTNIERGPQGSSSETHEAAGVVPKFNAHADSALLRRFRDSGHSTIPAMLEGHDAQVPKHQGQDVCLVWALKGECNPRNCKRKANHVRYPRAVVNAIHGLMDKCEVANTQA